MIINQMNQWINNERFRDRHMTIELDLKRREI